MDISVIETELNLIASMAEDSRDFAGIIFRDFDSYLTLSKLSKHIDDYTLSWAFGDPSTLDVAVVIQMTGTLLFFKFSHLLNGNKSSTTTKAADDFDRAMKGI